MDKSQKITLSEGSQTEFFKYVLLSTLQYLEMQTYRDRKQIHHGYPEIKNKSGK